MTKAAKLTQAQIDRFPEFRDKWIEIGLCTDPANRKEAERGIRLAYKSAGLKPPRRTVWTTSPLSNALTREIIINNWNVQDFWRHVEIADMVGFSDNSIEGSVWESVRANVEASVKANVEVSVGDSVWDSIGVSVMDSVEYSVWASDGFSFRDFLDDNNAMYLIWDSIWISIWDSVGDHDWESVGESFYGQHTGHWFSIVDYFKEVCGLDKETSECEGLRLIAKNAGWCLPHENICWISERHNILVRDDAGRLHCEDGPALAYPDGWSIYSWHGVRVPQWIITNPEEITIEVIHSETNAEWRRCMIERIGPENYLPKSGAEKVGTDECGTLWRRVFRNDVWCVVEVINGTREKDGSYKKYYLQVPPEMQTAREAVAWTYGLTESEYKVTLRT